MLELEKNTDLKLLKELYILGARVCCQGSLPSNRRGLLELVEFSKFLLPWK